jgi:hypothetical protein
MLSVQREREMIGAKEIHINTAAALKNRIYTIQ